MALSENKARSLRGELYHAFAPELVKQRARCARACKEFNNAEHEPRRTQIELWRKIVGDDTPLPPQKPGSTVDEDDALFEEEPWVQPPFRADNGINIRLGSNVFINVNCIMIDTCLITIGSRVLFAPNVSLFSGTHPTDPDLRNGTKGPESGKPITIGDDCWIGGNVTILPGVTIGKGSTVGAGSVVTKNVAEYSVVAGNPAKFIRPAPRNSITEEERQKIYDIAMQSS
ncbi:Acetyltransferase-like protein 4 [Elsinoe fawcettii]|nr:Acetyltransferase-like protein 4 [Elsinoe fawcettii]